MRDNNFRERMRFSEETEYRRSNYERNAEHRYPKEGNVIYLASKGTAHRTKQNKKRINTRVAALVLAATIGIGGVTTLAHNKDGQATPSITEIQELGINPQSMGLSQETIEQLKKYDEYFENFDPKGNYQLTDNSVMSMIDDIEQLHFSVVKEKIANLRGVTADDVKMYYKFQKGDNCIVSSVTVQEGEYGETTTYSNAPGLPLGIGKKNHLPSEIADVITQLEDLGDLESELKSDKISKINAIKELQKLYGNVESLATSELIIDEKGNISVIGFEQAEKDMTEEKER